MSQPFLYRWRGALLASEPTSTERLVALVLASHMSTEGDSCYPRQDVIAVETGLSVDPVRRMTRSLDRSGWIKRTVESGRQRGRKPRLSRPSASPPSVNRKVDSSGNVSFARANHRVGNAYRRRQVQVAVVGDTVEISIGEQLIRSHPVKHDRTREHGAVANPAADPTAPTPPEGFNLSATYRGRIVARVPGL